MYSYKASSELHSPCFSTDEDSFSQKIRGAVMTTPLLRILPVYARAHICVRSRRSLDIGNLIFFQFITSSSKYGTPYGGLPRARALCSLHHQHNGFSGALRHNQQLRDGYH